MNEMTSIKSHSSNTETVTRVSCQSANHLGAYVCEFPMLKIQPGSIALAILITFSRTNNSVNVSIRQASSSTPNKAIAGILSLLCMITLCLATTGCHEEKAAAETADVRVENGQIAVEVGSPSEGSISVETSRSPKEATLSLNGRITWDDTVTTRIFTPLGGRVSKINVANGQTVQRGDTLALITSPDYGQALADAQKAASNFNLKERTLGRVTELNAHGAAPLKDVQSAQADYEQSRSEKTRCEAKLSLYGDGKFGGSEYALKSLLDGVVVEKNINPGQELRPDQMLANVPQLAAPLFACAMAGDPCVTLARVMDSV